MRRQCDLKAQASWAAGSDVDGNFAFARMEQVNLAGI